jgi:hypothetical protein
MRRFSLLSLFLTSTLLTASPFSEEQTVKKGSEISALLLQKLGSELKGQMETNGAMAALRL